MAECGRRASEGGAISLRVRDNEQDQRGLSVTGLEGEPPVERLKVVQNGFSIDEGAPPIAGDLGVPGTEVTRNRQRNLRRPPE